MTRRASGAGGTGEDALVLGGGVAGCCAALALRARGVGVTLVERSRPGGRATRASAGMLAPQYEAERDSPLFRLGVESRSRWPEFARRLESLAGRSIGWRADGMLVANREAGARSGAEAEAARHRAAGLRAEVLAPPEAARLQPGLSPEVDSWLWLPDEARVDAQALAEALAAALPRAGVRVVEGREAAGIEVRGGGARGIALDGGERIEAGRVVVACGAWSAALGGLPRALPVRPVRGQLLRLAAPEPAPRRLLAEPRGRYLVPRGGDLLAGSTMEEAGFDDSVSTGATAAILAGVARLLPSLARGATLDAWAGLRPVTPDGLPIVGPDPALEGLLYATGYGRNGILLAPLAGEAVADLALGRRPALDWSPCRPERFGD